MKRVVGIILLLCTVWCIGIAAAGASSDLRYTDSYSRITFVMASEWKSQEVTNKDGDIRYFFYSNDNKAIIQLHTSDYWAKLPEKKKKSIARDEYDNSMLSKESFLKSYGVEGKNVEYSDDYFKFKAKEKDSRFRSRPICWCRMANGMYICFKYFGGTESPHYAEFEEVCKSLTVPSVDLLNATDKERNGFWTQWAPFGEGFGILAILAVQILPVAIYRFAVLRRTLDLKPAILAAATYALLIAAGFIAVVFNRLLRPWAWPAIVLGGAISFLILWNGWINREGKEATPVPQTMMPEKNESASKPMLPHDSENLFCWHCGSKLIPGSEFCTRCGKPTGGGQKSRCPKCGHELPQGVPFCHICGTKQ